MKQLLTATALVLCLGTPAAAQKDAVMTPPDAKTMQKLMKAEADPLAGAFFPPELVMKQQQKIGLSSEQRSAIMQAIQSAQTRFVEAQWQLETESATLAELVRGPRVDQQRALQQIDRVLDLERQIKHAQIELLVRIKNTLTEEQQRLLAPAVKPKSAVEPVERESLEGVLKQ